MHTHVQIHLGDERSPRWTYMNHIDDLQLGDYVVVLLPSGRYTMAKVVGVDLTDEEKAKATKWIVDKVTFDTTKHEMLTELSPPVKEKKKKDLLSHHQAVAALRAYRKAYPKL